MKYRLAELKLNPWISARTYLFGQADSRSYIVNEKTREQIQLDGLSSDVFSFLNPADGRHDEGAFLSYLEENDLLEEADRFIETLEAEGIIVSSPNKPVLEHASEIREPVNPDNKEYEIYIKERNRWLNSKGYLSSLLFELTYRCNLKCVHCYNPKAHFEQEIPFEKAKEIIDDAYSIGCLTITLSGGESTTYSHFLELCRYIRSKHISLEIFTNGQRLYEDGKLYEEIVGLYPHKLSISLYGASAPCHEAVTQVPGSFAKTKGLIERLVKDGIPVQVKDFLLNINCHDCKAIHKYAASIGADALADISLIPTTEGDQKTFQYALNDQELFELFVDLDSPLYVGENPYLFSKEKDGEDALCFGGFSSLCVNPNLNLAVCVSLPLKLGNLNEEKLSDIWKRAVAKDEMSLLYRWQSTSVKDLPECYQEDYCAYCHYCAGMGYLEKGYFGRSSILCRQAKMKMKAHKQIISEQASKNVK